MTDSKGDWGSPDHPSAPLKAGFKELHLVFHIRLFKSSVTLWVFSAWATPQEYELWKFVLYYMEDMPSHLFALKDLL